MGLRPRARFARARSSANIVWSYMMLSFTGVNSVKIRTSEPVCRLLTFMLIRFFLKFLFRSIINVICCFHFIALMHLTYLQRQIKRVCSFVTLTAKIFQNSTQDRHWCQQLVKVLRNDCSTCVRWSLWKSRPGKFTDTGCTSCWRSYKCVKIQFKGVKWSDVGLWAHAQ